MSDGKRNDPEIELAEIYLQTASVMKTQFEWWWVLADRAGDNGDPELQLKYMAIAMDALDIARHATADADLLLYDYDD
jgi:hypothetical protein